MKPDIENRGHQPSLSEMAELAGIPLFDEICRHMESEYNTVFKIEYSGDKILLGWNLKFKKSGKTLCTVYPRDGHFHLLLVIGRKEKPAVEELMPSLSEEFQNIYAETKEGMGQRWLLFDLSSRTPVYEDILKIVRIRRECR